MASFLLHLLLTVCSCLLASGQPIPLDGFESAIEQGEFMFSPCPRGPPCHSKTIASLGQPRTWATGYHNFGLWTTDVTGKNCGQKIYIMQGVNSGELEVYASLDDVQGKRRERVIRVSDGQQGGNGGVVYNNSYYYLQFSGDSTIPSLFTRLNLDTGSKVATRTIPAVETGAYGYSFMGENSGFDMAVSETGLYLIYSQDVSPHRLAISKVNPIDLSFEWTQVTNKDMNSYGECFVVCTKLYCTGSYRASTTTTTFVYDLYTQEEITQPLTFYNQYGYTGMLDYNPADKKLYAWDAGNLVTLDVNFST